MDVAFGIDGKLADVEAGPVEAAEEGGDLSAQFGGEDALAHLQLNRFQLDTENTGFRDFLQAVRVRAFENDVQFPVQIEADLDVDGFVKEWQQQSTSDLRGNQCILLEFDVDLLKAEGNAKHLYGALAAKRLSYRVVGLVN